MWECVPSIGTLSFAPEALLANAVFTPRLLNESVARFGRAPPKRRRSSLVVRCVDVMTDPVPCVIDRMGHRVLLPRVSTPESPTDRSGVPGIHVAANPVPCMVRRMGDRILVVLLVRPGEHCPRCDAKSQNYDSF